MQKYLKIFIWDGSLYVYDIRIHIRIGRAGEPVGAGCFWLLGDGAAWKKKPGAGAAIKLAGSSAPQEDKKH